jgi:hypothetical protein
MPLEAFLGLAEADQLTRVDRWAAAGRLDELLALHDGLVRWAELHRDDASERRWPSLRVFGRLLNLLLPNKYCETAQDGRLRAKLTPAALARMRQASYDGILAPLLTADEPTCARFIASLTVEELCSLQTLLRRCAKEPGQLRTVRSPEFAAVRRAIQERVAQRLDVMPRARSGGKPQ